MDLELDLIGGRGALASKKIVVAASPHKKRFCLKPLMAVSSSSADWHNEFDPFKTAYGGLSHSIFEADSSSKRNAL